MWPGFFRDPQLKQSAVTSDQGAFTVPSITRNNLVVVKKNGSGSTSGKPGTRKSSIQPPPSSSLPPQHFPALLLTRNDQPVSGADDLQVSEAINRGPEHCGGRKRNKLFGKPAQVKTLLPPARARDGRFQIQNFPPDSLAALSVSKPGKAQAPKVGFYLGSAHGNSRGGGQNIELGLVACGGAIEVQG